MGLADRDYMRERRNRGTLHSLRTNSLPSWLKAFVWVAVLGLLFVGFKYFLEREKAQPFPPTGAARWYIQTGGQATAPLTIKAPIRSGLHHVVRLDEWLARAQATTGGARLGYQEEKDGRTRGLLKHPSPTGWDDFTCLNSLRDVEPGINLILKDYNMDREPDQPIADETTPEGQA